MAKEYSLRIKKTQTGLVYESLETFGFAACDISWPDEEVKDLASRDWPGQTGEDVYFPPRLELKPYDLDVEFCYKGTPKTALGSYQEFRDLLTGHDGNGAELEIYDPYWTRGYAQVHVRKFGNLKAHKSDIDEVFSMRVTFRITNPLAGAAF